MKHVIFDCDNTLGVKDCDVDDGLALLYLLGCEEVTVHGVTCTYGNNKLPVVYAQTEKLLKNIGRTDLTVKKVANQPTQSKVRQEIISQRWQENTKANFPFLQPGRLRI